MNLGPVAPQPSKYRLVMHRSAICVEGLFTVKVYKPATFFTLLLGTWRGYYTWDDKWIAVDMFGNRCTLYDTPARFAKVESAEKFVESLKREGEVIKEL